MNPVFVNACCVRIRPDVLSVIKHGCQHCNHYVSRRCWSYFCRSFSDVWKKINVSPMLDLKKVASCRVFPFMNGLRFVVSFRSLNLCLLWSSRSDWRLTILCAWSLWTLFGLGCLRAFFGAARAAVFVLLPFHSGPWLVPPRAHSNSISVATGLPDCLFVLVA